MKIFNKACIIICLIIAFCGINLKHGFTGEPVMRGALSIVCNSTDHLRLASVNDTNKGNQNIHKTGRIFDTSKTPFLVLNKGNNTPFYGDPFPVFMDGIWHLYTLTSGLGVVQHLTSTDLVGWTEHTPALTGGSIATGTVLRHKETYYMFYTIGQKVGIGLVRSDNPWFFDRNKSTEIVVPDNKIYHSGDMFRDVAVFFNEQEKLWWMTLECQNKINNKLRADVALYKAEDLNGPWKACPPIYSQPQDTARFHRFVSCPQVFKFGNCWYLNYLSGGTIYHTSQNPNGPWGVQKGEYNSDFLTAGSRSATDGKRRLSWGFFSQRKTPEQNPKGYGGPLGVGRELVFYKDRSIGVRPLPELITAIQKNKGPDLFHSIKVVAGKWVTDADNQILKCTDTNGGIILLKIPEIRHNYYFEAKVNFNSPRTVVNVVVRTNPELDRGYSVALNSAENRFEINGTSGNKGLFIGENYLYSKSANLKIFIFEGMLEVFMDDRICLSTRVLDQSGHDIAIVVNGGKATIKGPLLHFLAVI